MESGGVSAPELAGAYEALRFREAGPGLRKTPRELSEIKVNYA